MIDLQANDEGVLLPVRARAGARRNAIEGEHDGMLKISITAAPEKGKANKAILALLSKRLGLPKSSLTVAAGETSTRKQILVRGITLVQMRAAIGEE